MDPEVHKGHVTMVEVPSAAIAFVTGGGGKAIRSRQDTWNTLLFFVSLDNEVIPRDADQKLAIFGDRYVFFELKASQDGYFLTWIAIRRGRRGAQLSIMQAIEKKIPGTFVDPDGKLLCEAFDEETTDEWGTELRVLTDDDYA